MTETGEKKLTERQELFCVEYVLNKGNATEAARRAGYSDSSDEVLANIGLQNLKKVEIITRIAQLREDTGIKTGANVEWLTSVLVSMIETSLKNEDSKGVAMNSSVLIKMMGWDKPKEGGSSEQPVVVVAVEGFTGWQKETPIATGN